MPLPARTAEHAVFRRWLSPHGLTESVPIRGMVFTLSLDKNRLVLIFLSNGGGIVNQGIALIAAFLAGGAFAGLALWKLRKYCVP